jgi:hypothetical protein
VDIDTIHDGIFLTGNRVQARFSGAKRQKRAITRDVQAPFSAKAGLKKSPSIA